MGKKGWCPFISHLTSTFPCLGHACQLWDEGISNCIFVALSEKLSRIDNQLIKLKSEQLEEINELVERLKQMGGPPEIKGKVIKKEENNPIDK